MRCTIVDTPPGVDEHSHGSLGHDRLFEQWLKTRCRWSSFLVLPRPSIATLSPFPWACRRYIEGMKKERSMESVRVKDEKGKEKMT